MEYASVVWDPYHISYSNMLEKIQRRAARWVTGCFDKYSSVSTILCSLGWPTLPQHWKISRLSLFHKIIYNSSVLLLLSYYLKTERSTRHHHPFHFIQPHTNTSAYQHSFFSQSIKDWNYLPVSLIEINNHDLFLSELLNYFDHL